MERESHIMKTNYNLNCFGTFDVVFFNTGVLPETTANILAENKTVMKTLSAASERH